MVAVTLSGRGAEQPTAGSSSEVADQPLTPSEIANQLWELQKLITETSEVDIATAQRQVADMLDMAQLPPPPPNEDPSIPIASLGNSLALSGAVAAYRTGGDYTLRSPEAGGLTPAQLAAIDTNSDG